MKFEQANPFPTDNRLRDDIGLPPLAELPPPMRLTPRGSAYFPADDRLRDDIGLLPLGEGFDVDEATRSPRRLALSGAALVRVVEGCVAAAATILHPRRPTRIIQQTRGSPL